MADMAYQTRLTLGDLAGDFDIPAIVTDLQAQFPGIANVDEISAPAYWEIIRKHNKTANENTSASESEPVTLDWLKFSVIKRVVTDPRTLHTSDLQTIAEQLAERFPNRSDYDRLGPEFWAIVRSNDRRGRRCESGECTHGRRNQPCYA